MNVGGICPYLKDTLCAFAEFISCFVLPVFRIEAGIESELFAVRGNAQHIIDVRIDAAAIDALGTSCDLLGKGDDRFGWRQIDDNVFGGRNVQLDHIGGLHVGKGAVKRHELRQVRKLCKARLCAVPLPARCKFH